MKIIWNEKDNDGICTLNFGCSNNKIILGAVRDGQDLMIDISISVHVMCGQWSLESLSGLQEAVQSAKLIRIDMLEKYEAFVKQKDCTDKNLAPLIKLVQQTMETTSE